MASTIFSAGTVIPSSWLNAVNTAVYTTLPTLGTPWAPAVGKTFTVSNTLTLAGTDGATLTIGTGSISGTNTGDQNLAPYAPLAGTNTFTGATIFSNTVTFSGALTISAAATFSSIVTTKVLRSDVVALGNITGTATVDMATASTFTATVTGNVVISFTNAPPTGKDQTVYLKLTNAGAFTTTYQAGTKFPGGVVPTYTAAGKDLMAVWYDVEQTCYVVGSLWKDYK